MIIKIVFTVKHKDWFWNEKQNKITHKKKTLQEKDIFSDVIIQL